MKTFVWIIMLILLPIIGFSQKGHHKQKNHNEKMTKTKSYNGYEKITVYDTKKYKTKRKGPPPWAPAHGYRHRYIYFPEHKCYYDIYEGYYIYRKGTLWVTSFVKPVFIINISTTKKVELNIDSQPWPQVYFEQHIILYR